MTATPGPVLCVGRAQVPLAPDPGHDLRDSPGFHPRDDGLGPLGDTAFWLGRLGVPTQVVARVGRDGLGARYRGALAGAGVDTSLLRDHPDLPTGLTFEDARLLEYPGADGQLDPEDLPAAALEAAGLLFTTLSSLRPTSTRTACLRGLEAARQRSTPRALLLDFQAGPGWSRYEAQSALSLILDEASVTLATTRGLRGLFPDFWDEEAVLEGLRELGARATLLVDSSGRMVALDDEEGLATEPLERTPSLGALLALVLARLRKGEGLLVATRQAAARLPALAGAAAPPPRGVRPRGPDIG